MQIGHLSMNSLKRLTTALLLGSFALLATPAHASCEKSTVLTTRDLDLGLLRYQPGLESGWALISPNGAISLSSGLSLSSRTPSYSGQVRLRARPGYDVALSIEVAPPALGGVSKATDIYAAVSRGSIKFSSNMWIVRVPKENNDFEFTDINIDIGAYIHFLKIGSQADKRESSSFTVRCLFERPY